MESFVFFSGRSEVSNIDTSFVYIMFDYDKADAAAGPQSRVPPIPRKHYFSSIVTVQGTHEITGIHLVLTKAAL